MEEDGRKIIKETLLRLSDKMSIEKINVSVLVKEAGISRTLFYYYYEDMFALLEELLNDELKPIIENCIREEDSYLAVLLFVEGYKKQFPLLRKIKGTKYYEKAQTMLNKLQRKYLSRVYDTKAYNVKLNRTEANFIIEFMASGITSYFFEHCDDRDFNKEKASQNICKIITKCMCETA